MAEDSTPRDYAAEYARRKARDENLGFGTPHERRAERAQRSGFPSEYGRTQFAASGKTRKKFILEHFGISERRFNEIRRDNRHWNDEYAQLQFSNINTYDEELDARTDDWSEQRVGYIISFHAAVVNPRSNYDSLPFDVVYQARDGKTWIGNQFSDYATAKKAAPKDVPVKRRRIRKVSAYGKKISTANMFFYLVKYAGIMSVSDFEARYGRAAIVEAARQQVPETTD